MSIIPELSAITVPLLPAPKSWEYKLIAQPNNVSVQQITDLLNNHGREGWELCAFQYGYCVFKRMRG